MFRMPISIVRSACALLVATSGLIAVPAIAFAQTPPPPPPKQEGTAELAFVGTTGNSSSATFSAGAEYIARPTDWLIKNRFQAVRGESNSVVTAESILYGFRAERALNARTSAFGEYGYFRDQLAGVRYRNGVTGGITFAAVKTDRQALSADVGLGYLNEQRTTGNSVSSGTYSGGAAYKLKLSDNADLSDELRLLGTFAQADDWRMSNTIAVTAKLTTVFSLKFSSTVRYANDPPPGFKTTDTTTSVALVAAFKSK